VTGALGKPDEWGHPITAAEVRHLVDRLRTESRPSPEHDHMEIDRLYVAVLRAVAEGRAGVVELAREALRIEDLDLERWYA
jgi:hypothetical protein